MRKAKKNKDYWKARDREHKHFKKQLKKDDAYIKEIDKIYRQAETEIQKDIQADILRFAVKEELSMAEAKKRISKTDVKAYQDKAKKYVKEKDFSERANREMRLYNITMRSNRLELLEANIHLELVALADEEEKNLQEWLGAQAMDEYKRQAGILGETLPKEKYLNKKVLALVFAEYKGTTFSNRVWQNQRELQHGLERTLRRTVISGENPKVASKELRKLVNEDFRGEKGDGGAKYAADRIAITESARVQTDIAEDIFKEYDIDQYIWIAEPDACDECAGYDGNIYDLDDANAPMPPEPHPFCRCSISPYVEKTY